MPILAPLLFVFLWSGAFIAVRAGIPDVSPITFLASRFSLAALLLLPVSFFCPLASSSAVSAAGGKRGGCGRILRSPESC